MFVLRSCLYQEENILTFVKTGILLEERSANWLSCCTCFNQFFIQDPDDLYGADHLHHHDDGERGHRDRRFDNYNNIFVNA